MMESPPDFWRVPECDDYRQIRTAQLIQLSQSLTWMLEKINQQGCVLLHSIQLHEQGLNRLETTPNPCRYDKDTK